MPVQHMAGIRFSVVVVLFLFLTSLRVAHADDSPLESAKTGRFITCLAQAADGSVWIGAEEHGLTRLRKNAPVSFTLENGLIDDSPFVLCADSKGSGLWVGDRTRGLSHFDGKTWTHSSIPDGLGGVRVYDIACTGRAVWCATENGVSRLEKGTWQSFTALDGLPQGEISALAADSRGIVWAGASCGGIRSWNGRAWTRSPADSCLDDILINDLLITKNGTLWLAANSGLYERRTDTAEWRRYCPSKLFPKIPEDHVTCLATGHDGMLWLGTRKAGLAGLLPDSRQGVHFGKEQGLPDTYVSAILPLSGTELLVGTYGYGACRIPVSRPADAGDALPSPCFEIPDTHDLSRPSAQREVRPPPGLVADSTPGSKAPAEPPRARPAAYLGEDWETQGDWIGTYGRTAYILPAMGRPLDYRFGIGPGRVGYRASMGPKHRAEDSLRYWTHWRKTDNPKSLQNPVQPYRTQASWDDAGETYPPTQDGPDVVVSLDLPTGDHLVSLYFVNIDCIDCPSYWRTSDGFAFPNRFRDYLVEIRAAGAPDEALQTEILARTRVRAFNSGVYKRFHLHGARRYAVTVHRQRSHNTILSGIFVDPVCAPPGNPVVPDDLPAIPGLRPLLAETAAALSGPAGVHAESPGECLLFGRSRIPGMYCLLKEPRDFLLSHPEVSPVPAFLDCMEHVALLTSRAGYSRTACRTYEQLGSLWVQHVKRSPVPATARAAFRRTCERIRQTEYRPELNHLRRPGREPAPHAFIMFRQLGESYESGDLAGLVNLAASCAKQGDTAPVADVLLPRIEKLAGKAPIPADALRAKGLCALRRDDCATALASFRAAAEGYADPDAKADALLLAVCAAPTPAEAEQSLRELRRIAPASRAAKDAARIAASAGAKLPEPPAGTAAGDAAGPVLKNMPADVPTTHTETKPGAKEMERRRK